MSENMKAELKFENLVFKTDEKGVKVLFLKIFYFYLDDLTLKSIGDYKIKPNSITFDRIPQKTAEKKFNILIAKGFQRLKNSTNGRDAVYVHKNSGIPLMGTIYFGLVDKGSDMLEIKPITGCNLNCIFCSVGEGSSNSLVDFVVEEEYLIEETRRLLDYKDSKMDIYINPHGEPLFYADLEKLISDLKQIKHVGKVILITNGTLLTTERVDKLIDSGVDSFNISVNALSQEKAEELAGTKAINVKKLKDVCKYIASKRNKQNESMLIITPVFLSGKNEGELVALGKFADEVGVKVITQNFMAYSRGKKPVKELSFNEFYKKMEELSNEQDITLVEALPKTKATREVDQPFKKGDAFEAEIVCKGRHRNEVIVTANGMAMTATNCKKSSGKVKIRLVRSMHNLFFGECVKK